ncbi:hypothetical protein E0I56_005690 [Escherichia coli]|nr:hypothetical protein [Escherichia coli]
MASEYPRTLIFLGGWAAVSRSCNELARYDINSLVEREELKDGH